MNILELDSYNLADAVKFHNRLNPRLWDSEEHLRPEVQSKLLEIAEYFQEFLGVPDLDVKDITISGSNAAYSYTKHSDIDLHLVVNMPPDPVYQELFNAKKYEFNDTHNIKIGGADVELYVQPADQAHHSQGIYSIKNNDWIQVPQRKRARIDDSCVRDKVSDLDARIHRAIKSGDVNTISSLWQKIKSMRKSGLEQNGEFGCENIAFKILRNKGCIEALKTALDQARDRELSLKELARPQQYVKYGFKNVEEASLADMRAAFQAELKPQADIDKEKVYRSRDEYVQDEKRRAKQQEIAKALVHTKPRAWPGGVSESPDGVDPTTKMFLEEPMPESPDGVNPTTAMFLTENDPESIVSEFIKHTAHRLGIKQMPEIFIHHDEDWSKQNHSFGMYVPERHELHVSLGNRHLLDILRTTAHELCHCAQHEQESLPHNAGTTGSPWENEAHAVAGIVMRDFADTHPEYFKMEPVKESASGYIPTKAQAKDPRYSMALTVDIKPGQVGKEANKLNLKTDKQGRPGLLMKTANLQETLAAEFEAFSEGKSYGYGSTPLSQVPGETEDELGNQEATGPEFPPQWPAGTTKIDVSDLTDWYRVGMDISDLDDAKPENYNQGPPQTVVVFPSDEAEQGYLKQFKRLGLKTHDMDPDVPGGEDKTGKHLHQKLAEEFALFETQDLFEINMGSKNLRREAAKTGAIAGMEFEMIVPNAEGGGDGGDMEPDYEYDERCRSIEDAYNFFYDGDWNSRRSCDAMRDEMRENYQEWLDDKLYQDWERGGEEYLQEWVPNNVDESEWNPDDLEGDARNEALEEYVANVHADPGSSDAFDEFREENQDSYDESDWLDDADLSRMSEIENAYSMSWPHWTQQGGGEASIEDVAQEFENAIGRDVRASGNYHSGSVLRPSVANQRYVVEPDGSLEADSPNDTGLEFVSPPLPIDEILSDLNKVKAWAKEYGCYTNDSTGLHINISVPDYSREKLDYVKLALLMGDKYVLDAFGRAGNTYTKSALDIIKKAVRDRPEEAEALLNKMKGNLDQLATKAIHSGVTSKYTSINTKDGHIEFRSPGGDWLDQNFDQIENTLLRFTVAMSAALNPEAYRQEYLTKLYKLLSENNKGDDTIKYFSDYVAGKIPKAALRSFVKQAQLQRNIRRGKTDGQKMWWKVYKDGKNAGQYGYTVEVVATSEDEAKQKAAKEWGEPLLVNTLARMDAEPLRPYVEQPGSGTYELFDRRTGEAIPDTEFSARNEADQNTRLDDYINHGQHGMSTVDARLVFGARPVADSADADQGPSANSLRPTGPGPWEIYNRATGNTMMNLNQNGQPITDRSIAQQYAMNSIDLSHFDNYGVRTIGTGTRSNVGTQTDMENRLGLPSQSAAANYAVVDRQTLDPVFRFQAGNRRDANGIYGEWLAAAGLPATTEDYGFQEIRPQIPEVPMDVAQNFPDRTDGRNIDYSFRDLFGNTDQASSAPAGNSFSGQWRVVDGAGRELYVFRGVGNNQADANRIAQTWARENNYSGALEVVPVMI
jgi:hypothetical protein